MTEREPLFRDGLFRRKGKKGAYSVVDAPFLGAPVADSHAHVHLLPDPALALARCAVNGVSFVCDVTDVAEDDEHVIDRMGAWRADAASGKPFAADAVSAPEGEDAACRARAYEALRIGAACVPDVRYTVGCHPHNARLYDDAMEERLRGRLRDVRVSAIGEIGLDYYYDLSPRDAQIEAFRRQLRLAHELELPVVLHLRDAHDDALAVLDEEGFPAAGVLLHCCSIGPAELEPWLDRDCYVAFGGAVTFGRSDDLRASARIVPDDRILAETDAPYMTPVPMRGMTCWADHVLFSAAMLADVRGCNDDAARVECARSLERNARALLDRPRTITQ